MKHKTIAITGSIATGKSTVIEIIKNLGYEVLDADKIAHELMEEGQINYRAIVDYFGPYIVDKKNKIDRRALGQVVFNDKEKLEKLNQLTHPNIFKEIERRIESSQEKISFLELPLLYELRVKDELAMDFDEVWLVYVDEKTQLKRLVERNQIDEKEAKKLIASQMAIEEKRRLADFIIYNDSSKEATREQIVKKLGEEL